MDTKLDSEWDRWIQNIGNGTSGYKKLLMGQVNRKHLEWDKWIQNIQKGIGGYRTRLRMGEVSTKLDSEYDRWIKTFRMEEVDIRLDSEWER